MKKILILAYDFSPYNSIGAQRPFGWYKYLKKFSLYPVIVTRHWDQNILNEIDCIRPSSVQSGKIEENDTGTVVRVPYIPSYRDKFLLKYGLTRFESLRKLLSFYYFLARFLSLRADNTSNIFFAADNYLINHKCDYILATGEPFILFRYAAILSKKHKIRWFADYRDGWSTNLAINSLPFYKIFIYKYLNKYFEKKYSSGAECFFCVSENAKSGLAKLFGNKIIHLCRNGFFEEDFENLSHLSQNKENFTISYIGNLYPYQPLELFLDSVNDFICDNDLTDVNINFYGIKFYKKQEDRILNFSSSLNKYITTTDRLPRDIIYRELKKSHLLLLLASDKVDSSCAKIYEYLPLDRKILLIKNDNGILEKIIDNCDAGVKCSSKKEITEILSELYAEFKKTGEVKQQTKNIKFYSRKNQASIMAKIILAG